MIQPRERPEHFVKFPTQDNRRSGRTTRVIDAAIQELYKKGTVTASDHFVSHSMTVSNVRDLDQMVFKTLVNRLKSEHQWDNFVIDGDRLTITLKRDI